MSIGTNRLARQHKRFLGHVATFCGAQAVRGEKYVFFIDPRLMKETRRIEMANDPGMTMFGPDGLYAFVCSSFTPDLAVVAVASHRIVKRLAQASAFCPNIAVSLVRRSLYRRTRQRRRARRSQLSPSVELETLVLIDPASGYRQHPHANHRSLRLFHIMNRVFQAGSGRMSASR